MSKICGKSLKILQNSMKILPKSTKNGPKSRKIRPWTVFGAKSRPGRLQDAPPHLPGNPFGAFLAEKGAPRGHLGAQLGSKIGSKLITLGLRIDRRQIDCCLQGDSHCKRETEGSLVMIFFVLFKFPLALNG